MNREASETTPAMVMTPAKEHQSLSSALKQKIDVAPITEKRVRESREGRKRGIVKWPSKKEKLEMIRRRSSLSSEQVQSLWLNYQEFCNLRSSASKIATESKDKGYSKLLAGAPNDEAFSQLRLDLWAKTENDLNMRGLERYVNSEHGEQRNAASRQARQAVLEAQVIAKESEELGDFAEYLAAISCQHSAGSKAFAKMMANADEKAVKSRVARIRRDPDA